MKRSTAYAAGLCLGLTATAACAVDTITLNFDGATHLSASSLSTLYSAQGVTFSNAQGIVWGNSTDEGQSWFDQDNDATTNDGTVIGFGTSGNLTGVLTFTPGAGDDRVGISTLAFDYSAAGQTFFKAFDGSGAPVMLRNSTGGSFVSELSLPGNNPIVEGQSLPCSDATDDARFCMWGPASFTFASAVRSITFSTSTVANNSLLDNMQLSMVHAAHVPEPSTYALLTLGLAGIAFYTRRRRQT
jgi:PEP-CTERM motif